MDGITRYSFDGGSDVLLAKFGEDLFDDAINIYWLHKHVNELVEERLWKTNEGRQCVDKVLDILYKFGDTPNDLQRSLRNIRLQMNFKNFTCRPQFANGAILLLTPAHASCVQQILSNAWPKEGDIFVSNVHEPLLHSLVNLDSSLTERLPAIQSNLKSRLGKAPGIQSKIDNKLMLSRPARHRSVPPSFREVPAVLQKVGVDMDHDQTSCVSRETRTTGDAPRSSVQPRSYGQGAVYKSYTLSKRKSTIADAISDATFGDSNETFSVGHRAAERLEVPDHKTLDGLVEEFAKCQKPKDPRNTKDFMKYIEAQMRQHVEQVVGPALDTSRVAEQIEESRIIDHSKPIQEVMQSQHVKLSELARDCLRSDRVRLSMKVRGESRFSNPAAEVVTTLSDAWKEKFKQVSRLHRIRAREHAPELACFTGYDDMQQLAEVIRKDVKESIQEALDSALPLVQERLQQMQIPTKREAIAAEEARARERAAAEEEKAKAARIALAKAPFSVRDFNDLGRVPTSGPEDDCSSEEFLKMAAEVKARLPQLFSNHSACEPSDHKSPGGQSWAWAFD